MSREPKRTVRTPPGDRVRGTGGAVSAPTTLGPLRSEHGTASRTHKINIAIAGGFTVLLGGAALLIGVNALLGEPGRGVGWAALFFALLAVPPAIGVFFLVRKLSWRLQLFQNGFVFMRGKEHTVLWNEVATLFVAGLNIDKHLEFVLNDGTRLKVDNSFKNFAPFAQSVRSNVSRQVVARADTALAKGEEVSFGKLKLSSSGLAQEGRPTLTWAQVDRIAIEGRVDGNLIYDALVVWAKGPGKKADAVEWAAKRISTFPNFDAFLEVAGRFTRIDPEQTT